MPADTVATLTSAVAAVVMVSAARLIFDAVQARNMHPCRWDRCSGP